MNDDPMPDSPMPDSPTTDAPMTDLPMNDVHLTQEAEPRHPGRTLLEDVMTPLGVSRNRLARDIDVPVGRVSEIVSGKRGITPDTALRLAKYFGTTPELWLRLQYEYDLHQTRMSTWPSVENRVRVLAPKSVEAA